MLMSYLWIDLHISLYTHTYIKHECDGISEYNITKDKEKKMKKMLFYKIK